ncbi:MAG: FIG00800397: hypothetical protein, partial [uncultured Sphingomonas sp.]
GRDRRRRAAGATLAAADLRLGAFAGLRHRRCGLCGGAGLGADPGGAGLGDVDRAEPGAVPPGAPAMADVRRHPPRGRRRLGEHAADHADGRDDHRAGGPRRWSRGGGRLRDRQPAGIPAGAAGLRPRFPAGRAGGHQCRRRPARPRAAHRHARRRRGLRAHPGGGAGRRGLAARLAWAVRRRPRHARHGCRLPARGGADLRLLRAGAGALLRLPGRRAAAVAAGEQRGADADRGGGRVAGAGDDGFADLGLRGGRGHGGVRGKPRSADRQRCLVPRAV